MKTFPKVQLCIVSFFLLSFLPFAPVEAGATTNSLNPIALSFPSVQHGYVLSLYRCGNHPCAALRKTKNGGTQWLVTHLPRLVNTRLQLVTWQNLPLSDVTLNIHFADAQNGWMNGQVPGPGPHATNDPNLQHDFWSTHDGGRTWTRIRLKSLRIGLGVIQMATHGAWTYLFGATEYSDSTPILGTHSTSDDWTVKSTNQLQGPAGGTELQGVFAFVGSKRWFIAGNDRGLNATEQLSSNGTWRKWTLLRVFALDDLEVWLDRGRGVDALRDDVTRAHEQTLDPTFFRAAPRWPFVAR